MEKISINIPGGIQPQKPIVIRGGNDEENNIPAPVKDDQDSFTTSTVCDVADVLTAMLNARYSKAKTQNYSNVLKDVKAKILLDKPGESVSVDRAGTFVLIPNSKSDKERKVILDPSQVLKIEEAGIKVGSKTYLGSVMTLEIPKGSKTYSYVLIEKDSSKYKRQKDTIQFESLTSKKAKESSSKTWGEVTSKSAKDVSRRELKNIIKSNYGSIGLKSYFDIINTLKELNISCKFIQDDHSNVKIVLENFDNEKIKKLEEKALNQKDASGRFFELSEDRGSFYVDYVYKANEGIGSILLEMKEEEGLQISGHPYYGSTSLDSKQKENFLGDFDPRKLPKIESKEEIISVLKPHDSQLPFNAEQIEMSKDEDFRLDPDDMAAVNSNADLGHQKALEMLYKQKVIDDKSGIILSHGHVMAGLATLAELGYDTTIFVPKGKWTDPDNGRLGVVHKRGYMWAGTIKEAKEQNQQLAKERLAKKLPQPFVIGLNGHRGDDNSVFEFNKKAHIDPIKSFGEPEQFLAKLKEKGLNKMVFITEHYLPQGHSPETPYFLSIEEGLGGYNFDQSNNDLKDYAEKLRENSSKYGIEIVVVSADKRVSDREN